METKIYELLMAELEKTHSSMDVPVAALLVDPNNEICCVTHNTREADKHITGHAELTLIDELTEQNHNLKLADYTLYVTLEPCAMCYSAAKQANIKEIYYLIDNRKNDDTKLLSLHDQKIKIAPFGNQAMKNHYRKIINEFFSPRR